MKRTASAFAIWLMTLWLSTPRHASASGSATYQPILPDGTFGAKYGAGIACVPHGERVVSMPANYAVRDIGHPGVPRLDRNELAMVRRIQIYVKSPKLRFTWVDPHREFIVYDAVADLCIDTVPGYPVLNRHCADYYAPGDDPTNIVPVMDCTKASMSRPWMKGVRLDD